MRKLEKLHPGGKVLKTHGRDGEIKMGTPDEAFNDLLSKNKYVFILNFGSKVPYKIKSVRGGDPLIVSLEGLNTPEEAEKLCGKPFYFLKSDFDRIKNRILKDPLKKLEGYLIMDVLTGKRVGEISFVTEVGGQLLATVNDPDSGKEFLIPLHSDLIVHMDEEAEIMRMDLPEGILDL